MMSVQELERQLLSLDLSDGPAMVELEASDRDADRTPQHPLRSIPINIPADFDEPMTDLWDALEA
jgi:hypothetical protein